jgi:nucleoside phosphorylase
MENGEIVEVEHPNKEKKDYTRPIIRFGMIAGGKNLLTNDYFKTTLSEKCNVLCFDSEIDQVLAAIQGNRTESFMIIRGISDYHDGTLNKEWQPYSALCAASLMKTIIYRIPSNSHSDKNDDEP